MGWLFDSANSGVIGGVSLLVTILGFGLTAWALRLTYVQAKDAKRSADSAQTAADAAAQAVDTFRFRLEKYAASHDLAHAVSSIDSARRHLMNDAWRDVGDSYENARQALLRVRVSDVARLKGSEETINLILAHMVSFGNRIDTALSGKGVYPDKRKILPKIREYHDFLLTIQKSIEKEL